MLAQISRATSNIMQALIPSGRMYQSSAAMPSTAPWADYWYTSMGLPNAAGIVGGDEAYQFVSACFAATRIYCSVGATMPLNRTKVTMSDDGASSQIMSTDPLHKLINVQPNPDQTAMSFRSMMIEWQINRGTCFAEIQRDVRTRKPLAYWPIHPSRCKPFRSAEDNSLWWHVKNNNATETDIADKDMLRIPYIIMDRTGLCGVGVSDRASQSIRLGQNLDRTENDASMSGVPKIVVEVPRTMNQPEQDAFRRQWRELHVQGGEEVALVVGGATVKTISQSAVDLALVARREFNIEEIARWYDVPPTLLRRAVKESAGNIEQLGQEFQTYSLRFLEMWEQELNIKTLSESERDSGQSWELDYKSLLRADHAGRSARAAALFPIGGLNSNEVRADEGLNPYKDGKKYFVQGALRPIDEPYSANDPQNPPMDPKQGKADPLKSPKPGKAKQAALKAGARTMLEDCLRRLTVKEITAARCEVRNPNGWMAWVDRFYEKHETLAALELKMPVEVCAVFGVSGDAKDWARRHVEQSKFALIAVADGPRESFAERVECLMTEWERDRASSTVRSITELN